MATADYDFEFTRNQVIERAFRIIGVITPGETLSAFQTTQGKLALNALVKAWQSERIYLWTLTEGQFSTIADTSSYSLGSDPGIIALDRAYEVEDANSEVPLEIISFRDYQDIRNKNTTGDNIVIALDHNEQVPTAYIWPVPSSVYTIKYLAIRRLKDMDNASDNPDMPQRFQDALCYGLADHLSDEYGLPLPERQRIATKYREMFEQAKKSDWERNDYEFVEPAYRTRR